jgi:flagellar hook-associated protein 2
MHRASTTNVQASIIQISSNQYEMILSATKDNADITTSVVSGDDVLHDPGHDRQFRRVHGRAAESQPAIFSVDGIT